ncbi:hypothetical protein GCM10022252_45910 [Streptosporangium oxazolinicum]|uniref:Uncharacterized protein n=1 Tax=Streptosporangium oxazolinicum TaxID=909287 RepID=A0ABP8B457_9ACTN
MTPVRRRGRDVTTSGSEALRSARRNRADTAAGVRASIGAENARTEAAPQSGHGTAAGAVPIGKAISISKQY